MIRVALLLFDDVDLLDVGGPYEVLLTANRLAGRAGEPPPFEVLTVSARPGPVTAYGGLGLLAGGARDDVGEVDVLVVPGTIDVPAAAGDARLLELIRQAAAPAETLVASVCTGSLLLARAGLLDGVAATTHHEDVEDLAALIGPDHVRTAAWVDAGRVVTAGGLSNGLAMALHLVDRLHSRQLAERTAAQLEYPWAPTAGQTIPVDATM